MSDRWRIILTGVVMLMSWHEVGAQQLEDSAKPLDAKRPSARELDRREALKLYGLGLICERDSRLLDALRNFEEAARLDPDSAAPHKALIALYLAVERVDDALAACRRTLELDPGDFETWYLRARLHKGRGETAEAARALGKALRCPNLKDQQPELALQIAGDLAFLREEMKDFPAAIAAYRSAAAVLENVPALVEAGTLTEKEINTRAGEVYERIANLCLQTRQFDKAVEALKRAQKKDPDIAARVNYHLAKVWQAQDKPALALRHLDEYLKLQPQGTEAYELKIELMRKAGRERETLGALKAAAERDTHNLALQLLLARHYAKARQWAEAEDVYKAVIREEPSPDAYRGLFTLYKDQGNDRIKDGLDQLDKALRDADIGEGKRAGPGHAFAAASARSMLAVLRSEPELVRALLKIAEEDLTQHQARGRDTWRFLAILAARTRQLDAAERLYRECLRALTPDDAHQVEVYDGLLTVLDERRKYSDMVTVCRKGLREAKQINHLLFYQYLTRSLAQLGKFDEALAEADKAVGIADDRTRLGFRLSRARLLSLADRHEKAITECLALLKENDDGKEIAKIRYALSGVYSTAHQNAKSEAQLRLILESVPKTSDFYESACNDLGYIMADQGKNLEEAEKLIREAIRLDREQKKIKPQTGDEEGEEAPRGKARIGVDDVEDHAAYIDSLGWVLFRRGRLEEARQELEKAVKLQDGGDDPVIWDHLGDVSLRMGRKDAARAAFGKAVELYEVDRRRKKDDQYKELVEKLRLLKP